MKTNRTDAERGFSFVDREELAKALAFTRAEAVLLKKTTQVVRSLGRSIAGLKGVIEGQEDLEEHYLVDLIEQLDALVSAFESVRADRGVNES